MDPRSALRLCSWASHFGAAAAATLGAASGLALVAPLSWLDAAAAFGDAHLALALALAFALVVLTMRFIGRLARGPAIVARRSATPAPASGARSYLR